MDIIKSPNWENRYELAIRHFGLDERSLIKNGLDPAVEVFCKAELRLFDKSLGDIQKRMPLLEKIVQSFRQSVADPFIGYIALQYNNIPILKRTLEILKSIIDTTDKRAKEFSVRIPPYHREKFFREVEEKELKPRRSFVKQYGKLLEETEATLPDYSNFLTLLYNEIKQKDSERLIITFQDYTIENENERNKMYKNILNKDFPLLGWDIKFLIRYYKLDSSHNEFMSNFYK